MILLIAETIYLLMFLTVCIISAIHCVQIMNMKRNIKALQDKELSDYLTSNLVFKIPPKETENI